MTRRFTGRKMAALMIAMFGTIVAVNFTMARHAVRTFGGVVVENSYVASQRYNSWLAQARAQKRLGWRADVTLDRGRRVVVRVRMPDREASGARVSAAARHPLGLEPERRLRFTRMDDGRFVSDRAIGRGRWLIHVELRADGKSAHFDDEVPA